MYIFGSKQWKKIQKDWHQVITTGKDAKPVYSYHYKIKSSKPCGVIELDTQEAKIYCGYKQLEKDLRDTIAFYDVYVNLFSKTPTNKDFILLNALVRSIIVTYGRCFASGEGRPVSLHKDKYVPKNQIEIHDYLIDLRNKYVAHAGGTDMEECKCVLTLPSEKKITKNIDCIGFFTELYKVVTPFSPNDKVLELFQAVHSNVLSQMKESYTRIKFPQNLDSLLQQTKRKKRIKISKIP